jgi:hypothetical protein
MFEANCNILHMNTRANLFHPWSYWNSRLEMFRLSYHKTMSDQSPANGNCRYKPKSKSIPVKKNLKPAPIVSIQNGKSFQSKTNRTEFPIWGSHRSEHNEYYHNGFDVM